jgi:hypothetical protein
VTLGRANTALRVFISYSHADRAALERLKAHLSTLRNDIEIWDDRAIIPGQPWAAEIAANIEAADIILLLVSADFFNSEFIRGNEVRRALERNAEGSAVAVPIIIHECLWEIDPLAELQALPERGNAITSGAWRNENEAYVSVARGLLALIERLRKQREQGRTTAAALELPLPIYVSYSEGDRAWFDRFLRHLRPFESRGFIEIGDAFERTLERTVAEKRRRLIETSHLILPLISANFLADPILMRRELPELIERHRAGSAFVLPVLVDHCLWQGTALRELRVLPASGEPVAAADQPERELSTIAEAVIRLTARIVNGA